MRKELITNQEKEAIISEYLLGDATYRKLAEKHKIDFRIIHSWVRKFQGKSLKKIKPKSASVKATEPSLPTDIKQLQEELRKAKLHNELLNAMIDIAEDQLKIDIRKKSGTKQ
jgi:transposase-like protein